MSPYPHLFSPIRIGDLELKNRGIMTAMVTNLCDGDGMVTDDFIAYHVARARGGVAMNTTEAAYVDVRGKGFVRQFGCDQDAQVAGMRRLADAVHEAGGLIAIQLYHGGRQANPMLTGSQVVAPSPIPCPIMQAPPHELTVPEIREIVAAFAAAARRSRDAGIDAIEIHGAHGYLLNQFLSPHTNHRNDEYGGDADRRARFPLEVVDAIRAEVGPGYPLIYRITADEFLPDGLTPQACVPFCADLVAHGVDAINVSGSTYEAGRTSAGQDQPLGLFVADAAVIRDGIAAAVPVAVANRIKTPEFAEQVLAGQKVDIVATGRPLLCDPDFYAKAERGDAADIRVCLTCNHCISELMSGAPVTCLYNPEMGRELHYAQVPAPARALDVVVVGGGLSGMEAAHTAAGRGHRVRLFEATDQLGGNVLPGVRPPFKSEMIACVDYEKRMLTKTGVRVETNHAVDADFLAGCGADQLIIATGSDPVIPPIPGADAAHVVTAEQVLLRDVEPGQRVVIIGGGSVGIETAELLAEQGHQVTVLEMADQILADMAPVMAGPLLGRLAASTVQVVTSERVVEITADAVVTDGRRIPCDTAVLAIGYASDSALAGELVARGIPHVVIGDATRPRKIRDAVVEGHDAGLAVGVS